MTATVLHLPPIPPQPRPKTAEEETQAVVKALRAAGITADSPVLKGPHLSPFAPLLAACGAP